MKTAVIYARYSSDSQTEQSIEGQLHVCNEYAKSHNIVILRTYIDRAMSGKTDKRPDFQQMLKDSARKEWDFVLVYKFDRFGRNRYETSDNIYPQIVPPEIYEIVRNKVNDNKYGKTSENVEYLLKNNVVYANGHTKIKLELKQSNQCK